MTHPPWHSDGEPFTGQVGSTALVANVASEPLMDIDQCAEWVGIPRRKLLELRRAGQFPSIDISPKDFRFCKAQILKHYGYEVTA